MIAPRQHVNQNTAASRSVSAADCRMALADAAAVWQVVEPRSYDDANRPQHSIECGTDCVAADVCGRSHKGQLGERPQAIDQSRIWSPSNQKCLLMPRTRTASVRANASENIATRSAPLQLCKPWLMRLRASDLIDSASRCSTPTRFEYTLWFQESGWLDGR